MFKTSETKIKVQTNKFIIYLFVFILSLFQTCVFFCLQSFVSCSYGIDKIGYVVTATFACSIVSMFIITRLIECIGRTPVILICK